jgi:hypothetical protein
MHALHPSNTLNAYIGIINYNLRVHMLVPNLPLPFICISYVTNVVSDKSFLYYIHNLSCVRNREHFYSIAV